MPKSGSEFPIQGTQPQELDSMLRQIPLQEGLEFNTHNTFGEHGLKEKATFEEFCRHIKDRGEVLPPVEDAFSYYLQNGPGRFYRAYLLPGDPMVAGMTIAPNTFGGYAVDNTYSIDQRLITAAAFHKMLNRNFFEDFGGTPPLGRTSNLTIPAETLQREHGLGRAVMDFGLLYEDRFVMPMPGVAPFPKEDISEAEKQQVRDVIKERNVTGILPYNSDEGGIGITTSEYYRKGRHVGTMVVRHTPVEGSFRSKSETEVRTVDGEEVTLRWEYEQIRDDTAKHVHVLKKLALADNEVAELILG